MKRVFFVALATAFLMGPIWFAHARTGTDKGTNFNKAQADDKLVEQSDYDEKRMIREKGLDKMFSFKITTVNQEEFDKNHNGYLAGRELHDYLRYYKR